MRKSVRNIYISLLVAFGLVLALPFAPLRKSLSNTTQSYSKESLAKIGVGNGAGQKIAGSVGYALSLSKGDMIGSAGGATFGKGATTSTSEGSLYGKGSSTYAINTGNKAKKQNNSLPSGYSGETMSKGSKARNQQSGVIGIGSISSPVIAKNTSGKTSSSTYVSSSNEGSNTSSKPTSTKQMANGGGPPPDEDGPMGSLPIGDGYLFSMLLASIFSILKFRKH